MTLLEKARAAVGLRNPAPVPLQSIVTCGHCGSLTSAAHAEEKPAAKCPECGRMALLMEGAEDVFACVGCRSEYREVKTYFGLRNGKPFTALELRCSRDPAPPSMDTPAHQRDYEEKLSHYTPAAIREQIEAERARRDQEDESARNVIERKCVDPKCKKFCWPIRDGIMTCDECEGQLKQFTTIYHCSNERCHKAGPEPRPGQIKDSRCVYCGGPAAKRPGVIRAERDEVVR